MPELALSSAQVMVKFLESDCPVIPGGKPVQGRHVDDGPREKLDAKKSLSAADIENAAACLGLKATPDGRWQ